ncbi:TrkH family potassium uptake protein [Paenibacillus bouchesdurhonensis]|uniref:TrkH family potassium uptake protein n=1 Tax=Paenibacillus bouchesdurhonensis TaxID=1870990 RepID=UPI000DA60868|nr:potassium transporter TrkG [Paenibacillus bouchesdurhonensis]
MLKRKKKQDSLSPAKILTFGFAIIIIIGTFLLSLGPASANGEKLGLINAFFMATSAVCVTGLVVVDPATQFSLFGELTLMILTQIGGLGFMTMGTMIALAFNRRISLRDRLVLQEAMKQNTLEGLVSLIRRVTVYSLVIESIGALLLAARWSFDMPLQQALYYGVFHSISIFNNAGFDLFGAVHGPYSGLSAYVSDPFVNIVVIILIVLGGIGFIVMSDLLSYRVTRRLSLHSKVVLTVSGILIVSGALLIFVMEVFKSPDFQELSLMDQIFASIFHSVSARSGGVSTMSVADMQQSTQFLLLLLMFIGAAPGSTGGGIKVTVFAILIGAMYAMLRGKEDIVFFRKRLSKVSILRAITQTWLALFLVILTAMILSAIEDRTFLALLFETTSAFATSGLSLDVTTKLTDLSKVILALVMFLGRIGPLTLAYALTTPKSRKELYRYPEGDFIIG